MIIRNALSIAALCALSLIACGDDDSNEPSDSGSNDSGAKDSGSNDSGAKDSGSTADSGTSDSGSPARDAGGGGGGTIDAGRDAGLAQDSGGGTDGGGVREQANIAPFGADAGSSGITGTAKFSSSGGKVSVVVTLNNCPDGAHPVHIHEGTSCADATAQGPHWGKNGVRGEGIPNVVCAGNTGTQPYTNEWTTTGGPDAGAPADAGADASVILPSDRVWTLDGNTSSDPKGHAFVVHQSPTDPTRIACGIIN